METLGKKKKSVRTDRDYEDGLSAARSYLHPHQKGEA